ncbi:zinc-binding dehydrogenase family oxidoreductase [Aspergillus pseudotamarii]|uniref:Zinc-binding dehydrogenase family oxidoreductase n=1 Tax=Aspergillus pseudotamarii TaxID=132259 RepID=A0A5N6SL51_ASPPS|nr:zinc-binding dehydrogenase family oxidoreductase [Aspergillus pseudotamarii]KAE8134639.1 zinc-binding dehydrogenase family oxidoreductase [Aspergillus pseudotamarii]
MTAKTASATKAGNMHSPKLVKESIPAPSPGPGQVLVKMSHVAQNPTDVQSFDSNAFGDRTVLGCDFVGEVVQVGAEVTRLTKTKGLGAYSEYCLADQQIAFKVPTTLSREDASTVPLALSSPDYLNLNRTKAQGTSVLVWGASVGLYSIQIASLYGFDGITTHSPYNAELVRSYAAPNIYHVFDTVGNQGSSPTASQVFRDPQGCICTVRPGKANTEGASENAHVTDVLVWTASLKEHRYGKLYWPASEKDHELASELFVKLGPWLDEGTIKPNVTKVLSGLDAISGGFQKYRDGKISAYKLVYQI